MVLFIIGTAKEPGTLLNRSGKCKNQCQHHCQDGDDIHHYFGIFLSHLLFLLPVKERSAHYGFFVREFQSIADVFQLPPSSD